MMLRILAALTRAKIVPIAPPLPPTFHEDGCIIIAGTPESPVLAIHVTEHGTLLLTHYVYSGNRLLYQHYVTDETRNIGAFMTSVRQQMMAAASRVDKG